MGGGGKCLSAATSQLGSCIPFRLPVGMAARADKQTGGSPALGRLPGRKHSRPQVSESCKEGSSQVYSSYLGFSTLPAGSLAASKLSQGH